MSLTVVGSLAFDAVETPFGKRDRMLGGAATHFALAASFFDRVHVVGPVGDDFGEAEMAVLSTRGTDVSDVERVAGGKTFFWAGRYSDNLNVRETLDTRLNVFADFQPKLSEASRAADVLFLANIQPDLQYEVREQCAAARFVAMDSMDLWINIARESLERVIARVDCLILNDEEIELLTGAPNLMHRRGRGAADGADRSWSPSRASTARRCSPPTTTSGSPPSRCRPSSTRPEPATRSPAASSATSPRTATRRLTEGLLRRAMAYGTALASFNVEEFGTERVARLTAEEIPERVTELRRITQFEDEPVELRG